MIALATIWELGWNTPLFEFDLWRFLVPEFQVDGGLWVTPVSGIVAPADFPLYERATVPAILEELGVIGVFLDQDGDIPLDEFEHPASCVYLTGATSYPILPYKRQGDVSVRVRTPAGAGGPWSHQIACLALYDRQVKSWPQP